MVKVISFSIRNRAAAVLFIAVLLALGTVFLTVGLALLAGLAVAGGILGTGLAAYRMIRGRGHPALGGRFDQLPGSAAARRSGLDPSLDVSPTRAAIVRPAAETENEP